MLATGIGPAGRQLAGRRGNGRGARRRNYGGNVLHIRTPAAQGRIGTEQLSAGAKSRAEFSQNLSRRAHCQLEYRQCGVGERELLVRLEANDDSLAYPVACLCQKFRVLLNRLAVIKNGDVVCRRMHKRQTGCYLRDRANSGLTAAGQCCPN